MFGVAVVSISAQSTPDRAIQSAQDKFFDVKNRSIEMDRVKRDAEKRPANTETTAEFPKIKEDFEGIQRLNGDVLQPSFKKTPVDYTAFLKVAAELNHRAVRLKSNLFAAESKKKSGEDKNRTAAESQEMSSLLADLDKVIDRFVHSSIFQNTNLVDSKASIKAQADLETIIKISRSIKEKTEKIVGGDSGK